MIYTQKLQEAINVSNAAHRGQKRIARKDIPYIVHPLSVALILSRAGASEDAIIAGILHDVVEDTEITLDEVRERFGKNVANIVDEVTEKGNFSWDAAKKSELSRIKSISQDGLLVRSADFLHNMRDTFYRYKQEGAGWFDRFNTKIPKEKRIEYWSLRLKELEKAWPKNPLLPELKEVMDKFKE